MVAMIVFVCIAMLMIAMDKGVPMFILPNIGCTTMLGCASFISGALVRTMKKPAWVRPLPLVVFTTLFLLVIPNMRLASVSILHSMFDAPYALLTGVLGSVSLLIVSRWLYNAMSGLFLKNLRGIIIYIGKNTLAILALHFLCFKLVNLLKVRAYGLSIEDVGAFPILTQGHAAINNVGWVVLYVSAGVGLPIALMYGKDFLLRSFRKLLSNDIRTH